MRKVITYGTYDLLHYGHRRLLERAKALGDYLIVGVTSDDYDKSRGKINVKQSLIERMQGVQETGLADEIIVEEYEGQKIDDIKKYDVDVFAIGSDWLGKFDYLKEYCEVIYLDRTEGVSSTELRREENALDLGLLGNSANVEKVKKEAGFVDGLNVRAVHADGSHFDALLKEVNAVYIYSKPEEHYAKVRQALLAGKHVLCESPLAMKKSQCDELFELADKSGLVLMEALKTAFSTAYTRLLLLLKSGKIGDVISVDTTCTSMEDIDGLTPDMLRERWNSICDWGPTALLPIFQILGTAPIYRRIISKKVSAEYDTFSKIDFVYDHAVASAKVGKGVKSEGEMVITGTRGYIYVPAPWWKTDFFEVRYEDQNTNQRYFYQLEGEGIRYELVAFLHAVHGKHANEEISRDVTRAIASVMEAYASGDGVFLLGERA